MSALGSRPMPKDWFMLMLANRGAPAVLRKAEQIHAGTMYTVCSNDWAGAAVRTLVIDLLGHPSSTRRCDERGTTPWLKN